MPSTAETSTGEEIRHVGKISPVCQSSFDLCKKLEVRALKAEHEERQRNDLRNRPQLLEPAKSPQLSKPVAEQLKALKHEAHLSFEELAGRIGIDERSVRRHVTGKSVPHGRHLRAYEREFSKSLGRRVVIGQMS
jgi:ribosome-binding protein aMBF1 (putative translation factor)